MLPPLGIFPTVSNTPLASAVAAPELAPGFDEESAEFAGASYSEVAERRSKAIPPTSIWTPGS